MAFGPNARLNQGWFTLGGGKEVLNEFYKKYNCIALLAGNTGCQMGGWYRKEINSVDDLKGLKMRIGGFPGRVLQKLGGVPQQIAGGDIYPALVGSGWLDRLLDEGVRYAFVSNSDNLGAVLDPAILQYFADSGAPFLMEVTRRTAAGVPSRLT